MKFTYYHVISPLLTNVKQQLFIHLWTFVLMTEIIYVYKHV